MDYKCMELSSVHSGLPQGDIDTVPPNIFACTDKVKNCSNRYWWHSGSHEYQSCYGYKSSAEYLKYLNSTINAFSKYFKGKTSTNGM